MYDLFGYDAEVGTCHIRRFYQWKQALAFSRDECSGATSLHCTRNIPAMRSHEAELPIPTLGRRQPSVRPALCTCCSTAFWVELVRVTIRNPAFLRIPGACFTSG
jgi:hypothetical protein